MKEKDKFHLHIQKDQDVVCSIFDTKNEASFDINTVKIYIDKCKEINAIVYVNELDEGVDPGTAFVGNHHTILPEIASNISKKLSDWVSPPSFFDKCNQNLQHTLKRNIARFKALGCAIIIGKISFENFMEQWLENLNPQFLSYQPNSHKLSLFTRKGLKDARVDYPDCQYTEPAREKIISCSEKPVMVAWVNKNANTNSGAYKTATVIAVEIGSNLQNNENNRESIFIETHLSFDQLAQEWQKKGLRLEIHQPNQKVIKSDQQTITAVSAEIEAVFSESNQRIIKDGSNFFDIKGTLPGGVYYFYEGSYQAEKIVPSLKRFDNTYLFIFGKKPFASFQEEQKQHFALSEKLEVFQKEITIEETKLNQLEESFKSLQGLVSDQDFYQANKHSPQPNFNPLKKVYSDLKEAIAIDQKKLGEYGYDIPIIEKKYEAFSVTNVVTQEQVETHVKAIREALGQIAAALQKHVIERIEAYEIDKQLPTIYSLHTTKIENLKRISESLNTLKSCLPKMLSAQSFSGPIQIVINCLQTMDPPLTTDGEKFELSKRILEIEDQIRCSSTPSVQPRKESATSPKLSEVQKQLLEREAEGCKKRRENLVDLDMRMANFYKHYKAEEPLGKKMGLIIRIYFEIETLVSLYLEMDLEQKEAEKLKENLRGIKDFGQGLGKPGYTLKDLDVLLESLKRFVNNLNGKQDANENQLNKIKADLSRMLFEQAIASLNAENVHFSVNMDSAEYWSITNSSPLQLSALHQVFGGCGSQYVASKQKILIRPAEAQIAMLDKAFSIANLQAEYKEAEEEKVFNDQSSQEDSEDSQDQDEQNQQSTITDESNDIDFSRCFETDERQVTKSQSFLRKSECHPQPVTNSTPTHLQPVQSATESIRRTQVPSKNQKFTWSAFFYALIHPFMDTSILRNPAFWLLMVFLGVTAGFIVQEWLSPILFASLAPSIMIFMVMSACAVVASLWVSSLEGDKKAGASTEAENTDSEIMGYFKSRLQWASEYPLAACLIWGVGGVAAWFVFIVSCIALNTVPVLAEVVSTLSHLLCSLFLDSSFLLPVMTVIASALLTLLPLVLADLLMRVAMTVTEAVDVGYDEEPCRAKNGVLLGSNRSTTYNPPVSQPISVADFRDELGDKDDNKSDSSFNNSPG